MCVHSETVLLIESDGIVSVNYFYFDLLHAALLESVYRPIHKHISISFTAILFQHDEIIYLALSLANICFAESDNSVFRIDNCNL